MLLCLGFNTSARYATIIGKKKQKKTCYSAPSGTGTKLIIALIWRGFF